MVAVALLLVEVFLFAGEAVHFEEVFLPDGVFERATLLDLDGYFGVFVGDVDLF